MRIEATPTPGKSVDELEQAIDAEIDGVKAGPIAGWEIEKARNTARRQLVGKPRPVADAGASRWRKYALFFSDPGRINTRWERIAKVTRRRRPARREAVSDAGEPDSVIVTRPAAPARRRREAGDARAPRGALDEPASRSRRSRWRHDRASAQEQPSPTQGVVRKGKVPVSSEVLKVTLPKPAEVELPNGLRLMVLEDHRLPQISFQMLIPGAGGYDDPADQPGSPRSRRR